MDSSAATDPYWVQFLPDFSMTDTWKVNGKEKDLQQLEVVVEPGQGSLKLIDPETRRDVELKAWISDGNVFQLFAVLTQIGFTAAGADNEELYLAVFRQNGAAWQTDTQLAAAGVTSDGRFSVRIIEVMVPRKRPSGPTGDCWAPLARAF